MLDWPFDVPIPFVLTARVWSLLNQTTEDAMLRKKEVFTPRCIEFGEQCRGTVEYRKALTAFSIPFPRCDFHHTMRLGIDNLAQAERNKIVPSEALSESDPSSDT